MAIIVVGIADMGYSNLPLNPPNL